MYIVMYLCTCMFTVICILYHSCARLARAAADVAERAARRLRSILYYILYYTILYYTILYYTILYYTILYHTIPYHTIPYRYHTI